MPNTKRKMALGCEPVILSLQQWVIHGNLQAARFFPIRSERSPGVVLSGRRRPERPRRCDMATMATQVWPTPRVGVLTRRDSVP